MRRAASPRRPSCRRALERLLPVGTLDHVGEAVELLLAHRERGGRVLVIGDFDADGATSTALMLRALRAWGFPAVDFLVPDRFEFGYGLTPGDRRAGGARASPALIVTVDNGISSHRRRRRGARARHRRAGHRPPPAGRATARRPMSS